MNILQIGKYYPPVYGGIETVMNDITEVLNAKGYKTDVLCSNKAKYFKEDIINGYKVIRVKSYGTIFSTSIAPQMIFKLRGIINEYDILHIHLPNPMANLALLFAKIHNKKIILHWHSDIIKQKHLLKLYEPLQNWLMKKADTIIATTPKYIEESLYLQKYKNKCVSIPIGIDKNKLQVKNSLYHKLKGIYKNKKIIFSLGRLTYYKGFKYLIDSSKYLSDDFVIIIGGSGPLANELKLQIINNGLENKVKLIGKIDDKDLGAYYKACDLFCLPSIVKSEAFGVVQLEAMSFGKPIVATKIKGSGVDWVNLDGGSGLNVEVKDSQSLAEAFKKILLDQKRYNEYSQNALNRFKNYFLREKMVESIIRIYEK